MCQRLLKVTQREMDMISRLGLILTFSTPKWTCMFHPHSNAKSAKNLDVELKHAEESQVALSVARKSPMGPVIIPPNASAALKNILYSIKIAKMG